MDAAENGAALTTPVTIGVDAYISQEYARAERDKLWRKVWQQVGRVEDVPKVGSFLTYDILDDSIVVVRTGAAVWWTFPKAPKALAAIRSHSSADSTAGPTTRTALAFTCPRNRTGRTG
jgi:phenylpropionate dioxygenase-like ring-hydroxylating dioxygenase large terminal subunit